MMSGQCLCGGVCYQVEGSLGAVRLCYCELCRQANGSVFSANARVPLANYRMVAGADLVREYESSPGAFRGFCSRCGSPVHARVAADADHIRIRVGGLTGDTDIEISAHVWVRSKPAWYTIEGTLPQYQRGADGLPMPAHEP